MDEPGDPGPPFGGVFLPEIVDAKRSVVVHFLDALKRMFGSSFEGVIHDFADPEHSVVYMAGNVTGRDLGAPVTDLVLRVLRTRGDNAADLIGYETRTRDGRRLKSSTIFLRDEAGKVVGCACLNFDLTHLDTALRVLQELSAVSTPNDTLLSEGNAETFGRTVEDVLAEIVREVLAKASKAVPSMEREDKLRIVQQLDQRGVFLVRHAVEYVANMLGASKYTIYSYLEEARAPHVDTFVR